MTEDELIFRTPPIIRQRRIAAVTIMVAAVLLFVMLLFVTGGGGHIHRITSRQENQLESGMSKDEVLRVLGEPHGKYDRDDWYYWSWSTRDPLRVVFDAEGRLDWWASN